MRAVAADRLSARLPRVATCLVVGALVAVAGRVPIAAAHLRAGRSGELWVKGMSEGRLRSFETAVFGPEHAAEHANERKQLRLGAEGADAGTALLPPAQPAPAEYHTIGRWEAAFDIPVIGINAMMLPTGKVMWFAYPVNADERYGDPNAPNTAQAYLWDPSKGTGAGTFKRVDPPDFVDPYDGERKPANIWCAGQTFLQDGQVLVAGGNLTYARDGKPFTGLNKLYTFDPWSEKWAEQPSMPHGRWYPSVATMPDGRAVIMSGLNENDHDAAHPGDDPNYSPNLGIDVFTPPAKRGGKGKLTTLGDRQDLRDPPNGNPPDGGLYPHLFWMPSGRLMVAGPDPTDAWFLHYPGPGFRLSSGWDSIESNPRRRLWGSGVLVPSRTPGTASTKVELIGGTVDETPSADTDAATGNTSTTSTFDEAEGTGPWREGKPMTVPRSHLNTVLAPDGSMVSVGGGSGTTRDANQWAVSANHDERQVEIFDPVAATWRLGAAQNEDRAYHSTAILTPEAKILAAGDDYNGATGPGSGTSSDTAQVYDPPYLFNTDGSNAHRPVIRSAPSRAYYGSKFQVATPDADVTRATLVAPGAATHANDMNQRAVPLAVSKSSGGVKVTLPSGSGASTFNNVAPPGYYMLFLLNSKGVPSVAKWVHVSAAPPSGPAPKVGRPSGARRVAGDRTPPAISFSKRTGVNARRGTIRGRARDASGVRKVQVALRSKRGRRCRWWSPKKRGLARRSSCSKPRWITARLRRAGKGGTYVFTARLRRRVRRGRYLVALRAYDKAGNVTSRTGAKAPRVSVHR